MDSNYPKLLVEDSEHIDAQGQTVYVGIVYNSGKSSVDLVLNV